MSKHSRLTLLYHRIYCELHRYKQRKRYNEGPFETDPTDCLLPQLALFSRAFKAISDYSDQNNKAGMIFGGWLANSLHNRQSLGGYPDLARRLKKSSSSEQTWRYTRFEKLPELVRQYAPPEVSQQYEYILSGTNVLQELGLKEDLSDLALAPPQMMERYSNMLHHACLDMRLMVNVGQYPPEPDEASKWTEHAYRRADINGKLAKMLSDLPHLAVHWSPSAQRKYWSKARRIWQTLPESYRDSPSNYMRYFRP